MLIICFLSSINTAWTPVPERDSCCSMGKDKVPQVRNCDPELPVCQEAVIGWGTWCFKLIYCLVVSTADMLVVSHPNNTFSPIFARPRAKSQSQHVRGSTCMLKYSLCSLVACPSPCCLRNRCGSWVPSLLLKGRNIPHGCKVEGTQFLGHLTIQCQHWFVYLWDCTGQSNNTAFLRYFYLKLS